MATVIRTRTIIERCQVADDNDLDFDPRAAAAVARSQTGWQTISDAVTYEVHDDHPDGCTVHQLTGRSPKGE